MSRIGKKPIAMPANVKYTVEGNTVLVEGPKGKVTALIPQGITLVKKDNDLIVERQNDSQAGFHGLARALVFNAVTGVTTGWTKELDIVGIGYRYDRPQAAAPHHLRHRPAEGGSGGGRHAFAA
jgi:large subunit ribosomal protein L6